jgi:glutathione S-transferase
MVVGPLGLACGSLGTLAVLVSYGRSIRAVAEGRKKHNVVAPATEGPPEFQRALRAQQNVLEYLPIIIPLLWMCAVTLPVAGPLAAVVGGALWAVFRAQYVSGYLEAPEKRAAGFKRSLSVTYALVGVALVGVLYQLALALE